MASPQSSAGPDKVIPLHFFDDTPMFTRITMYALMVFDEVLDPEKLRSSLDKLVRRDTWQKLGGRVRKGAKGLEYHVPQQFTQDRPAIAYTHLAHDMPKADHPIACKLPTPAKMPTDRPATVGNPEEWAELACGADSPKSLEDYTLTDRPVLGLRIVSFTDSTLVTIHWLHVASDAMGLRAIVDSWVLILQGREDEVPSLHGFDEDPLRELGMHPEETYEVASSALGSLATGSYVLRNGYRLLVGKKENRTVCIPPRFWQKMREDCLQELRDAGDPSAFLTENDVLTAWWSRLAVCHLPADKPVTIMQAMSARKALAGDLLPPDRLYVGNCLSFKNLLRTKKDMDASLGRLAGDIRKAVNTQGTRAQVEAYQAMVRANAWPLGPLPVFFGASNMHHVGYSNWFKSGVYMADFSSAAVKTLDGPLTPCFVSQIQTGLPYPEGFIITGKDAKGNYWLEGYRPAGLWEKVEKELAAGTK
ncbi:hypothetical protein M406DRAFT_260763 [Cryphonectria parasitica EP155]|uniref:Uncharacterized protein n=1 Tax=Cryphonectria parasitica (strain ATCC 38755 / EP155) TaxID=660469 RepID=A0A9P5CMV9_CRYP1|nr:uncharacterized protein M406DRAFT_260763 [Cryphonectria parasitica EP155]KAF3764794.1 hypothetical protein M406DRAFT_260763 [Cryphonectria parasitica EP155]